MRGAQKMLASTVQFSTTHRRPAPTRTRQASTIHRRSSGTSAGTAPARGPRTPGPLPQDPTACLPPPAPLPPRIHAPPTRRGAVLRGRRAPAAELVSVPPSSTTQPPRGPPQPGNRHRAGVVLHRPPARGTGDVLLRKEVIQPHLPVRLPCYDFVPIADPAFDGSLPPGVGPPASGVTDFRDVTGGVYKARERIHRSVADLRLLATPTSWGRVADPNPN